MSDVRNGSKADLWPGRYERLLLGRQRMSAPGAEVSDDQHPARLLVMTAPIWSM
jgi:hypothetical protein